MTIGLLENAPLASFLVDAHGRITWCNVAAARLLAREPTSIVGVCLHQFADAERRAGLRDALRDLERHADPLRLPTHFVDPDGALRALELHATRLDDDTILVQAVEAPATPAPGHITLTEQRRFRTALLELSELSHEHIEEDEFYDVFIRRAILAVPGAQAGSILRRVPGTAEFEFVATSGFDLAGLRKHRLHADQMFRDLENPVATINTDFGVDDLPEDIADWLLDVGRIDEIVTNVSAPVTSSGEAVAFVSLDNFDDPHAFDETSVEMTTVLGRLIADLIRRRRLESELRAERESFRHLAHHDGLTGLANRRHIEHKIADTVAEANRTLEPLAVLFIDLDDFKTVNDTLGHDAGDRVLIAVADTLKLATRPPAMVGRWGGDEFVIVAPGVPTRMEAQRLGQRVLDLFDGSLRLDSGATVACELSIGIAWSRDGTEGFQAILHRADEALYRAKTAGKRTIRIDAA